MGNLFALLHEAAVHSVEHHPNAIVRAMPYILEAAFWLWVAYTFWVGLRWQYERISGNTPAPQQKTPGQPGFEAPEATMPDGTRVRAVATRDWQIAAWEPIPDARDARVMAGRSASSG
jgi:hypothetical protein